MCGEIWTGIQVISFSHVIWQKRHAAEKPKKKWSSFHSGSRMLPPVPSVCVRSSVFIVDPLVLQVLWERLLAVFFFNGKGRQFWSCGLLFEELHLWRGGYTGAPREERWRSAPTGETLFASRCDCQRAALRKGRKVEKHSNHLEFQWWRKNKKQWRAEVVGPAARPVRATASRPAQQLLAT